MRRTKKVLLGIAVAFIGIQAIQPPRNDDGDPRHEEFLRNFNVSGKVGRILENSCFDCHSGNTKYPWYTFVQPFGWWMDSHIASGRSELDFDKIQNYSARRKLGKLKSIRSAIEDGTMPLGSYTFVHRKAKLSENDKKMITDWAANVLDSLEKTENR